MHEGDLQTEDTLPRLGIDQLRAGRCELGERRCDVVHLIGDVVHPGPRFARNLPTGVSSPSAASSSIRLSPTRIVAASTPCSSTRARCSSRPPKRRSYVAPPRRGPGRQSRRDGWPVRSRPRSSVRNPRCVPGGPMGRRLPLVLPSAGCSPRRLRRVRSNGEASKSAARADARQAARRASALGRSTTPDRRLLATTGDRQATVTRRRRRGVPVDRRGRPGRRAALPIEGGERRALAVVAGSAPRRRHESRDADRPRRGGGSDVGDASPASGTLDLGQRQGARVGQRARGRRTRR